MSKTALHTGLQAANVLLFAQLAASVNVQPLLASFPRYNLQAHLQRRAAPQNVWGCGFLSIEDRKREKDRTRESNCMPHAVGFALDDYPTRMGWMDDVDG